MDFPSGTLIGTRIQGLQVESVLGSGGVGIVYRAVDLQLGKAYAIKVLIDPEAGGERFEREAKLLSGLDHPGIVKAEGQGQLPDGRPYLIMELLEGEPLDARLARGPLPLGEAVSLTLAVLEPLIAAHAQGVIHRDLKPSNIFVLGIERGDAQVKLVDFGLAKAGRWAGSSGQTRASTVAGTPQYMSPEQIQQLAPSPQSDLYALGATLFHLLSGSPPFPSKSWPELIAAHLNRVAPRVSTRLRVPEALDEVIAQMLEKDPARRPSSASEVREVLRAVQARLHFDPTVPVGRPLLEPPPRAGLPELLRGAFGGDWRWAVAGLGALAVLGGALSLWLLLPSDEITPPTAPARVAISETDAGASEVPKSAPEVVARPATPPDPDFDARMKAALEHEEALGRKRDSAKPPAQPDSQDIQDSPLVKSYMHQSTKAAPRPTKAHDSDHRCSDPKWKAVALPKIEATRRKYLSAIRTGKDRAGGEDNSIAMWAEDTQKKVLAAQTEKECAAVLWEIDDRARFFGIE